MDPEVTGVPGIIDVYRQVLEKEIVKLHGPTCFNEVINLAKEFAEPFADPTPDDDQKYYILLIVTDGVINDIEETIHAIVEASSTPLSIIIVGVGDNEFADMDRLDADEVPLQSSFTGEVMARDIVQFVPFAEYKDKSYHELAMATLDEIPREVVNYFSSRGIQPKPPKDDQQIMEELREKRRKTEAKVAAGLPVDEEEEFEVPQWLQAKADDMLQGAVSQGVPRDLVEFAIKNGLPTTSVQHLVDVCAFRKGEKKAEGLWYKRKVQKKRKGGAKRKKEYSAAGVCKLCFFLPIDCSAVPCNHSFACKTCMKDLDTCIQCDKKIQRVFVFP